MMLILSRRAALLSSCLSLNHYNHPINLFDTVQLIIENSPATFRRAVKDSSDRFLYRGERNVHAVTLLHPEPDLLTPETYGDDAKAIKFFKCLEGRLPKAAVKPSVGHIGTSSKAIASKWGTPVSVWPLCEYITYLWPCMGEEQLIYDPNKPFNDCQLERIAVNTGLEQALTRDKEILFATHDLTSNHAKTCSFLACPSQYDDALRRLLVEHDYGLS